APEEMVDHLSGRIDSIARVQSKIMRSPEGTTDLEEMLHDEISAQADSRQLSGAVLEGPPLLLSAAVAETLGLAFHELATNALKFGALSRPDGKLSVTWSIDATTSPQLLRLVWSETGVRAVSGAPRRQGFGYSFVTEAIPYQLGGETSWELSPGRFVCSFS